MSGEALAPLDSLIDKWQRRLANVPMDDAARTRLRNWLADVKAARDGCAALLSTEVGGGS